MALHESFLERHQMKIFWPLVKDLVSAFTSVAAFIVLSLYKRRELLTLHQVCKFPLLRISCL
jgi:hypothetical protein